MAIEEQTARLTAAAALLDVTRHFTLDGRLVGDIGEMLAAQHFEMTLDETQRGGHDAIAEVNEAKRDVQIKCRKASTLLGFTSVPDLLVIIGFAADWSSWKIVYNGEGNCIGSLATQKGYEVDGKGRIKFNGQKASLDIEMKWFRGRPPGTQVPFRLKPLEIFKVQ